jgi:hypothetical protein
MEGFRERDRKDGMGNDEQDERVPIDTLAQAGHFKQGDLAGFDTYDVGITDKGVVLDTSSGGRYDEQKGPSNTVISGSDTKEILAKQSGLSVTDETSLSADHDEDETGNDAAAQWLRKNDPNFK